MDPEKKLSYGMEKRMTRLMTVLGLLRSTARGESSRGWTARQLAEECSCKSERTVRRTINDLREDPYFAKIEYNPLLNSYVLLKEPEQTPVSPLGREALRKLVVSEVVLRESQNEVLGHWVGAAVDEVFRRAADSADELRRKVRDAFMVKPLGVGRADVGTFTLLLDSILDCREIVLRYWTGHAQTRQTIRVRPHLLVQSDGMWYLYGTRVGVEGAPDELRMYSLPRMRKVSVLSSTFVQPDAKLLKQRFRHALGIIDDGIEAAQRVRFEAKGWARRLIEERHWGAVLKKVRARGDIAEYEMMLSRPEDFERWCSPSRSSLGTLSR